VLRPQLRSETRKLRRDVLRPQGTRACELDMCQGWRSHGSVALQVGPAGAGRVMLVVRPGSEGAAESAGSLPNRRLPQCSPRNAAGRDGSSRLGARREGRRRGGLQSRNSIRVVCLDGQLRPSPDGVLAQLRSRGAVFEEEQELGEVVVEWNLVRSHLEEINGWKGLSGFASLCRELRDGPREWRLCLPKGTALQGFELGSRGSHAPEEGSEGATSGRAPLVASGEAETSGVESVSLESEACDGSLGDDSTVEYLQDCPVLPEGLCPDPPAGMHADAGPTDCSAQVCEDQEADGTGKDWELGSGAWQPASAADVCCRQQPEGHRAGTCSKGTKEAGAEAANSAETFDAKAGRVQSMVDELLGATSTALDDNSRCSAGLTSLKSKFQSLLNDIHAMQREVGCVGGQSSTPGAPMSQDTGCKESMESSPSMPSIIKACDGVIDQKACLAGSLSADGKDDTREPCPCEASLEGSDFGTLEPGNGSELSEDWDCDDLDSACSSEDDGQDEDRWSNWSYVADEADLSLSGALTRSDMGLNLRNSQCGDEWGIYLDLPAGAGFVEDDPIVALTSVSSEESLTCLAEGDEGLVSLCRDDSQALSGALSDGRRSCSPDLEDYMRSLSSVLVGTEEVEGDGEGMKEHITTGEGDREEDRMPTDTFGAQDSSCNGGARCLSDCLLGDAMFGKLEECWWHEVEDVGCGEGNHDGLEEVDLVAGGVTECVEAESMAKPTSSAKLVANLVRKAAGLPRDIFFITDEGYEDFRRIGTFNHFEGVGCWQAGGRTVGMYAGSGSETCAEMIEWCGNECPLEGSVHGIRCDKKGLALISTTYIGCSVGSQGRCTDSSACPVLGGGDSLDGVEVIALREQRPQQWSRIIITDPELFFEACWQFVQSGFVDDVGAMALAVSRPPIDNVGGHEGCLALVNQWAHSGPTVANLALGESESLAAPEPVATMCLPLQKSVLVLCSLQSSANMGKLNPRELHCGECGMLGSPTAGCVLLSSSLDMKWFSDALQRMVQSGSPLAMLEIFGGAEELECDGIEEMGTIAAYGFDHCHWSNECATLSVATHCLGSHGLVAWRAGKCRVMTQCTVGGVEARYDGGGLVALQIALERPRQGGGARLQHGMCIHTSGDADSCVWCLPARKKKAGTTALMRGSVQSFWRLWVQMWLKRTQHACQFFMHLWTPRVEKGRRV